MEKDVILKNYKNVMFPIIIADMNCNLYKTLITISKMASIL